jgi:hypothetical protein
MANASDERDITGGRLINGLDLNFRIGRKARDPLILQAAVRSGRLTALLGSDLGEVNNTNNR